MIAMAALGLCSCLLMAAWAFFGVEDRERARVSMFILGIAAGLWLYQILEWILA